MLAIIDNQIRLLIDRALAIDPQHAQAQQGYGSLLASLGRLPAAIAMTQRVTELEPLMPSA